MKKLFLGLMVLIALSSCENQELVAEVDNVVYQTNNIIDDPKTITPTTPTDSTGVGPVVTIPPR